MKFIAEIFVGSLARLTTYLILQTVTLISFREPKPEASYFDVVSVRSENFGNKWKVFISSTRTF